MLVFVKRNDLLKYTTSLNYILIITVGVYFMQILILIGYNSNHLILLYLFTLIRKQPKNFIAPNLAILFLQIIVRIFCANSYVLKNRKSYLIKKRI